MPEWGENQWLIISKVKLDNVVIYSGLQGPKYESLKYLLNLGILKVQWKSETQLFCVHK